MLGTTTLAQGLLGSLLGASAGNSTCAADACPAFRWQLDDWSPCPIACGGGHQSRGASCVDAAGAPAPNASLCPALDLPLERACNTAPCTYDLWLVGAWGACEGGVTWRAVQCVSSAGALKSDADCAAPKPAAAVACVAAAPASNSLPACESGVSDSAGACCPSGASLDAAGACCASGRVDACGVCAGAGAAVAADGTCCPELLDAGGLCCASGRLDAMGACDGDGTSGTLALNLTVLASQGGTAARWAASASAALAEVLETSVFSLRVTPGAAQPLSGSAGVVIPLAVSVAPTPSLQLGAAEARVREVLAGQRAFGHAPAGLRLLSLDAAATLPTCGNGICELGERLAMLGSAASAAPCLADCPVPLLQCPASDAFSPNETSPCSGRGTCLSGTGACTCWAGYAGAACESCAFGYAQAGPLCMRTPSVAVKALPDPPQGGARVAWAGEPGASPLLANYQAVLARAHFGAAADAPPAPAAAGRRLLGGLQVAPLESLPGIAANAVVRASSVEALGTAPVWLLAVVLIAAVGCLLAASTMLLLLSQRTAAGLPR
eukprot:scaffold28.g7582.t1